MYMHGILCMKNHTYSIHQYRTYYSMTALGELCCVALSFCCVVLPYLAFLSVSLMIKVM